MATEVPGGKGFSPCLLALRALMPHPETSNLFRWFPVWRAELGNRGARNQGSLPLLVGFTGSYATSRNQQSVPLVSGCGVQDLTKEVPTSTVFPLLVLFTSSYAAVFPEA
jgi:hypothetical protein